MAKVLAAVVGSYALGGTVMTLSMGRLGRLSECLALAVAGIGLLIFSYATAPPKVASGRVTQLEG